MKITFLHVFLFSTILLTSLLIGYLADDLFDKRWYGYLILGVALSCFLYLNNLPKPIKAMEGMPPYLKISIMVLVLILLLSAIGFLSKIIFGLDIYKPLLFGAIIALVLNYKNIKPILKKQ